jgi:hypothetical protein
LTKIWNVSDEIRCVQGGMAVDWKVSKKKRKRKNQTETLETKNSLS